MACPSPPRPRWAAGTAAVSVAALALTSSVVPAPAARAQATCTAGSLTFAAHPDDDLIFMSPDLLEDVTGGSCSRTVYLTAGDAALGQQYWAGREDGVRAAYTQMMGTTAGWTTKLASVAGYTVTVSTSLSHPQVSLVFLRLPDGLDGRGSPQRVASASRRC